MYFDTIIYACSIISVFILICWVYKLKRKIKILNKELKTFNFEDIYKETDNIIEILFNNLTTQSIIKEYLMSRDTLNTEKIRELIKETYLNFKSFMSKDRYSYYDSVLNHRYDELIIKIIYNKIIQFEIEFKLIDKNFNNRK